VPAPQEFEHVERDDIVQFSDPNGSRAMSVNTVDIHGKNGRHDPSAKELHANFGKRERHDHELSGPEAFGYASLKRGDKGLVHIDTSRESDGSVLTCTFTFGAEDQDGTDWALGIWRQIRRE
jgi:hypothetical protein